MRSARVLVGEKLVEELYPIKRPYVYKSGEVARDTLFEVKRKKEYSHVLPDDQKSLVDKLQQLSDQYGFELDIVDVTREDLFYRALLRLKRIKNFPVVELHGAGRLQSPFSENELEKFVSN